MNLKTLVTSLSLFALVLPVTAMAADINVSGTWARASAGAAKAGGAFMTLMNTQDADDTLISATGAIAKRIELHTHIMDDGVMRMREVKGGIPIPAGDKQMLKPGGYHVMLMGLAAPLKKGSTFPLTLKFKSGYETVIEVEVKKASAMSGGMSGMGHESHDESHGESHDKKMKCEHDGEHKKHHDDEDGEHDEHGEHGEHDKKSCEHKEMKHAD